MPKEFYTEKDIEDLFQRGVHTLRVSEDVVLTELAYEKANRLGLELVTDRADNPPAAPVRPYLSEPQMHVPKPTIGPTSQPIPNPREVAPPNSRTDKTGEVEQRIRSAVIARLGNQVDAKLLDSIIHRVVRSVGLK